MLPSRRATLAVALTALMGTACSSTSVNSDNSGGSNSTGGSGGNGGSAPGCSDNGGGLLAEDGTVESSVGLWSGDSTRTLSETAACGAHSLQFSGPGYTQVRHDFIASESGSYVLSLCARAVDNPLNIALGYAGPPTSGMEQQVMPATPLGVSAWQHLESIPMNVDPPGQYTVMIAVDGPPATKTALIDCVAIEKK
jgi:hypothetical protein